jgi:hypothetical protein
VKVGQTEIIKVAEINPNFINTFLPDFQFPILKTIWIMTINKIIEKITAGILENNPV